jgi:hypothetical protein
MQSHALRLKKFENYGKYVGVTGSAEYAKYVLHDKKYYQRTAPVHHSFNEKLPFIGISETSDKFNSYPFEHADKAFNFKYNINPTLSVQKATYPRRLAKLTPTPNPTSEYNDMFIDRAPEDRSRFEWMRK